MALWPYVNLVVVYLLVFCCLAAKAACFEDLDWFPHSVQLGFGTPGGCAVHVAYYFLTSGCTDFQRVSLKLTIQKCF